MQVNAYSFLTGNPVTIENVMEAASGLELNFSTTYKTDYVKAIFTSMSADGWTDKRLSWAVLWIIKHHKFPTVPYSVWNEAGPTLYQSDWYSTKRKEGYGEGSFQTFRINGQVWYRLRENDRLETLFEEIVPSKTAAQETQIRPDDRTISATAQALLSDNAEIISDEQRRSLVTKARGKHWLGFLMELAEIGKSTGENVFRNLPAPQTAYPPLTAEQKLAGYDVVLQFRNFYKEDWQNQMKLQWGSNWRQRVGYSE